MSDIITISSLHIYPVKSLAGIDLNHSELDAMGLKYDRRWMLVSPEGNFLSQRKTPQMALINTAFDNNQLILSTFGKEDFVVPEASQVTMVVDIWGDAVNAQRVGDTADQWLSEVLGIACHLVYIPDEEIRQCDMEYSEQGDHTGFADGFPILIISTASLDDLNDRLDNPVKMKRFRPNIVVTGCEPFAEDSWNDFRIGNLMMKGVKPCSRCILTTVNPDTGKRDGSEPLHTLMTFRKQNNNVYFGQNVIHKDTGIIHIGDNITLT